MNNRNFFSIDAVFVYKHILLKLLQFILVSRII